MKIAVAGGTGAVGRHVVEAAQAAGHEPLVLTRSTGVDITTGAGLADALRGADAVIDVANTTTMSAKASTRFFEAATGHLLAAEREAGVGHHVTLSIIGAVDAPESYYAGKAAQERLVMTRPDGWSVLRASQFHEFVPQILSTTRIGPLQLAPKIRMQPVSAAEVAAELVAIAEAGPSGLVADLAGPREEDFADLSRRYLAAVKTPRRVLSVPFPGAYGRALRNGTLLPRQGARLGRQTFTEWLAATTRVV
ncbi:MAG: NAD(P)H-binding protein [Promicromonosporaceae bacterium]|nr:NAD(P)H-binding protein [Promicromonosporaceae bacterium]